MLSRNEFLRAGVIPRNHLVLPSLEVPTMNEYGRRALTHWERWRPTEFGTIQDPEVFFSPLGETAASQVDELADRLAGPDPAGEGYLEKVGRLNAAKRQAEELVLAELVYLTPEPGTDEDDEDLDSSRRDVRLRNR